VKVAKAVPRAAAESCKSISTYASDIGSEPIDVKKQNLYAVKILSKQMLIKAKQVDHVFNEMSLMSSLNHPFIVSKTFIKSLSYT
jgi:hypothetical protein